MVGDNGSGKSTLLDALCFACFGRAFRNINKPGIVNSVNQRDCLVELEFQAGSKQCKIIRGIKPNIFEIWVDGSLVKQDSSVYDYQDYLEKFLLKMNFKSFTQIVILGSASFTPFMQLKPADRRNVIEELLDIQIFSTMNVITKKKYQLNKDKLDETQMNKKILNEKKNILESTLKKLEETNEDKILTLQEELNQYQVKIQILTQEIKDLNTSIDELNKDIADPKKLKKKHDELIKLQNMIDLKLSEQKKNILFYSNNDTCPTCKQDIVESFKASMVKDSEKKKVEYTSGLKEISENIKILVNDIVANDEKMKKISDLTNTKQRKEYELENNQNFKKKLKSQLESLVKDDVLYNDNKQELENTEKEISDINNTLKEIMEEREYLELILSLLKDGGVKSKIIKQYLPVINQNINKYLTNMDFFVNFTLDENFEETIKSRFKDVYSYENFSEGEKMRIDLALLFSWREIAKMRNSSSTNLLILDEIFDSSLDSNGTNDFLKIMKNLGKDTTVFVISHKNDQLIERFEKVIKFKKHNSFSRIIDE